MSMYGLSRKIFRMAQRKPPVGQSLTPEEKKALASKADPSQPSMFRTRPVKPVKPTQPPEK